jgi:N-sulfoglucosamine sulfohydrolase
MGNHSPQGFADRAREFIQADRDAPFFVYACSSDPHRDFGNGKAYPGNTPVFYDPAKVIVPPYLPDTPEVRGELAEYYQSISRLDDMVGRLLEVLSTTGHDKDTLVLFLSDNGMPFPGAKCQLYDAGTRLPLIARLPAGSPSGKSTAAMVTWADILPTVLEFTGSTSPKYSLHGR